MFRHCHMNMFVFIQIWSLKARQSELMFNDHFWLCRWYPTNHNQNHQVQQPPTQDQNAKVGVVPPPPSQGVPEVSKCSMIISNVTDIQHSLRCGGHCRKYPHKEHKEWVIFNDHFWLCHWCQTQQHVGTSPPQGQGNAANVVNASVQ